MKRVRPDFETSNVYSTTLTKGLSNKMSKVGHEIDKIIALNGTDTESLLVEGKVIIIKGELDGVPAFAHPYYYNEHVIIDARAFVNKEGNVKDLAEYQLLKKRALIEAAWIEDSFEFGSQMDLIVDVFASWYANGLTKRLNMSMVENQQLRVLAAIYYLHFLHREEDCSPNEVNLILLRVLPRILRVPTSLVDDILSALGEEDIAALYCYEGKDTPYGGEYHNRLLNAFNKLTDGSYRLNNNLVMNSLTRGAFIAANSPELTGIAIEHPPTFFIMTYFALQKGIHGKTTVGLAALSVARKHDEEKFNKFMLSIFNQ